MIPWGNDDPNVLDGYYEVYGPEDWFLRANLARRTGAAAGMVEICHEHQKPITRDRDSFMGVPVCFECEGTLGPMTAHGLLSMWEFLGNVDTVVADGKERHD